MSKKESLHNWKKPAKDNKINTSLAAIFKLWKASNENSNKNAMALNDTGLFKPSGDFTVFDSRGSFQ